MPQIKIDHLTIKYPPKKNQLKAIDDLNVEFESGKVSVILGPSGCGKTTLIKSIIGVLDINEGDIYFDDVQMNYISVKNRNVSYVDQNIRLYPHLSIFNNIAYPLTNTPASADEIKERVNELAKLLHIEHLLTRKPRQISLGQAQRVALAKAIIKKPNVYLLDEPFSSLDAPLAFEMISELKPIFSRISATVVFVTHNYQEAFALGDYFYVMDEGKIVDKGTAEEILHSSNKITKGILEAKE